MSEIMAFDPGGTTGFAAGGKDSIGAWGQCEPRNVWAVLNTWKPTTIVCEKFVFRPQSHADLQAVEVIGVIKEWARQRKAKLILQTPEQAKHFWKNDRLKELGLLQTAQPHANDAIRHLCYYLTFGEGGKDGNSERFLRNFGAKTRSD